MQLSNKTYILILLILVVGLSLASYWQLKKFSLMVSDVRLPEIKMPETRLEDFFSQEKEGYREWISPDGKLKLEYPAKWIEMDEAFLKSFTQAGVALTDAEILLFAQQLKIEGQSLAFLTVGKIGAQRNLQEIVEEMEQNIEEKKGKKEITILKTEGEVAWLEMVSEYPGQPDFYSRGQIIFGEGETYIIIFTAPKTDWSQFEEETEKALNSVQLLTEPLK